MIKCMMQKRGRHGCVHFEHDAKMREEKCARGRNSKKPLTKMKFQNPLNVCVNVFSSLPLTFGAKSIRLK